MSLLQSKEAEREEDKKVVEERFSLQIVVFAIHGYSPGQSAKTLRLFWNKVRE